MSTRDFDGSDDVITVTQPAHFAAAFTWVAVTKRSTTGAWSTVFSIGDPAANALLAFNFTPGGDVEWQSTDADMKVAETSHTWDTTAWRLNAVTYDNAAIHRFHSFDGSSWFHGDGTSTGGNPYTQDPTNWGLVGGSTMRFGNWNASFNFYDGLLAMQTFNIGTALSDGALEALAGGQKEDYQSAGFDHLWEFNQASTATAVEDFIGALDQTAITGTTVIGDDPPSSIYAFEALTPVGRKRSRPLIRV